MKMLRDRDETKNLLFVNEDGMIRYISIVDSAVVTYQGISVGDDVSKIEDLFEYEEHKGFTYEVLFDKGKEVERNNAANNQDCIVITYWVNAENIITEINICDVKFSQQMR